MLIFVIIRTNMTKYAKKFFAYLLHFLSPLAMLVGFLFDYFTLTRIDRLYDNVVILTYLFIAGIGIIVVNMYESRRLGGRAFGFFYSIFPLVIQFSFGGLFSAFTVFYSKSATLAGSWPFLLLMAGFLIGNEFLKRHYRRFTLQVSVYFFVIFSYAILVVPTLLKAIGPWIFILSGLLSLVIIEGYLWIMKKAVPYTYSDGRRALTFSIIGIFVAINIFYFTNIIPPVPLSLKQVGVYHSLVSTGDNTFRVEEENKKWYSFILPYEQFHLIPGGSMYVVSSVYAPSQLKAKAVHVWEHFDEDQNEWVSVLEVPFTIVGGRLLGYRGYSMKKNLLPGKWRINVETDRGQLIGRIEVKVYADNSMPKLKTIEL